MTKQRLDRLLVDKGLAQSRQRARALIMAGKVLVNHHSLDKPGSQVSVNAEIRIRGEDIPYVSRGGLKLKAAIDAFEIDVNGLTCLDVGASTGGFTDCLIQHGARKVFAVDVGYGQLAWPLRQDDRVTVMERTNIRYLAPDALPLPVDLATVDVSFISLKTVVPAIIPFLKKKACIVALIKPQFEVGKGQVGKGGIVRDPLQHESVLQHLTSFFQQMGLTVPSVIPSPIMGQKGNREFLAQLRRK
jgi:23S rRNA (cytidine1920-2'-O)/16S rRNA (cytidine1409-2'-O)-methyltransferase